MLNYHEILGISPNPSLSELKKAYRVLAKKYHPDSKHPLADAARFNEITEAYEALKLEKTVYSQTSSAKDNRSASTSSYAPYDAQTSFYADRLHDFDVEVEIKSEYSEAFESRVWWALMLVLTITIFTLIGCRWYYKSYLEQHYEKARIEQIEFLKRKKAN